MIFESLDKVASGRLGKVAIIDGGRQVTYGVLLRDIRRLVTQLEQAGVKRGDAVALLIPNSIDFAEATFAVMAIGAVVVPINIRYQPDEVNYYLETSDVRMVLYSKEASSVVLAISEAICRCLVPIESGSDNPSISELSAQADLPAIHMYSSGSTGKPKRVTRTQGNLLAEYKALAGTIDLSEEDRILCTVPLYHAHGFGNCLFASLLSGATLVIMQGEFNPREATRLIAEQRITLYPAVPFMFKMIADSFYSVIPDLSSVRLFFSAGAPLPIEVGSAFEKKFTAKIRQLYGSTETGAVAINFDGIEGSETSVGTPLNGICIDVLDEAGQCVLADELGEVAIKSPAMTCQYDGLEEMTKECFHDGYFFPGDLGAFDKNGRLYIKGRKKLLINVAGNKVDPVDVENVIKGHPQVHDVVVLGQPHSIYGEMVKAVVVGESTLTQEEIIELCVQHLVEYKVPKVIEFRSEIPRSPLGKILRKYL